MSPRRVIGEVTLTKPLNGMVVKVKITRVFHWRLWATRWLIALAVWVSGGEAYIESDTT